MYIYIAEYTHTHTKICVRARINFFFSFLVKPFILVSVFNYIIESYNFIENKTEIFSNETKLLEILETKSCF